MTGTIDDRAEYIYIYITVYMWLYTQINMLKSTRNSKQNCQFWESVEVEKSDKKRAREREISC